MAQIAQEAAGLGNLLKRAHPWMDSEGYGIEIATTAAVLGQVVKKTGSDWAAITAAPADGDVIGVVLDATKEDAAKKRILVKGEAIVGKNALVYFAGATDPDKATANAALEAVDIQVNDQI
jgi:hypothetical protein